MELTQFEYFGEAARTLNFTKAADHMHISQPALSKSIGRLEEELGVKLFERIGKEVFLNEYGQIFLERVNNIFHEISDAQNEIKDLSEGAHGRINIATSFPVSPPQKLFFYMKDFYMNNPQLSVHVYFKEDTKIAQSLINRELDFSFSFMDLLHPDLVSIPLETSALGIVVGPNHPLAGRQSIRLIEIANERFHSNGIAPDLHDSIYLLCRKAGFEPVMALEMDSAEAVGEAVAKGFGVALVTKGRHAWRLDRTTPADPEHSLVYIALEDDFCQRILYFRFHRHKRMSVAQAMFYKGLLYTFGCENQLYPDVLPRIPI